MAFTDHCSIFGAIDEEGTSCASRDASALHYSITVRRLYETVRTCFVRPRKDRSIELKRNRRRESRIELEKADDGPRVEPPSSIFGWHKPSATKDSWAAMTQAQHNSRRKDGHQ